jgi:hypothetical protein
VKLPPVIRPDTQVVVDVCYLEPMPQHWAVLSSCNSKRNSYSYKCSLLECPIIPNSFSVTSARSRRPEFYALLRINNAAVQAVTSFCHLFLRMFYPSATLPVNNSILPSKAISPVTTSRSGCRRLTSWRKAANTRLCVAVSVAGSAMLLSP